MLSAIAMILGGLGSAAAGGLGLAVLPDAPIDVATPLGQ